VIDLGMLACGVRCRSQCPPLPCAVTAGAASSGAAGTRNACCLSKGIPVLLHLGPQAVSHDVQVGRLHMNGCAVG